jgi:alkylhydroperoxidase/carboxymuconolactone decarboxylase family protein YurZ
MRTDSVERHEHILQRLAVSDDSFVESILADERANRATSTLDPKVHALARLAALVAIDAESASYMWAVDAAYASGATDDEIVGVLVAVIPAVGSGRVVSAASKLGLALGYDVADALERLEPAPRRSIRLRRR